MQKRELPGLYSPAGLSLIREYLLAHQHAPEKSAVDSAKIDFRCLWAKSGEQLYRVLPRLSP